MIIILDMCWDRLYCAVCMVDAANRRAPLIWLAKLGILLYREQTLMKSHPTLDDFPLLPQHVYLLSQSQQ